MPDNPQQLKAAIDSGRTGDKVDQGFDPGLSPLGTDDEAAGSPVTPAQVRLARQLETTGAPAQPPEQSARSPKRGGLPVVWLVVAVLVLVVAALAAAVWTH